jgi:L-fucose isomerase-like protein
MAQVPEPNLPKRPKVGVIFIGRRRPGFDLQWGNAMEERVRTWLRQEMSLSFFECPEKVVDDASLRRVMAACDEQRIDAVVVVQATMGDGRLSPTIAQLWPDPVILWSTPENQQGDMISSCSLVGTHVWASVLRQMGHGFELVNGAPESAATQQRFREAVLLAVTKRRLRTLRLGVIGGQAPGFFAMGADPFSIHHGLGVQLQTYSLIEFSNVLNELKDDAVAADVAAVKELRLPHQDTTDEDLPMASRLYLTMRSFFENENLDALSIRDWPEMPNVFGQWPYVGVARLADEGRAIGIEGDVDGALTAWIGESLGLGRCYLTDWLEHDEETITIWHGGAAPLSLCEALGTPGGPTIARHFNSKKPAVIEATIRSGLPMTLARLWRCDGKYFVTAREGETLRPRRHLMMTNGLARLNRQSPAAWFEELCHLGMPHHVAFFAGHHEAFLRRFARSIDACFV